MFASTTASNVAQTAQSAGTGVEDTLHIDGASLFYGGFRAVKDVTLQFKPRAVTSIIGPSGCGKSTLLRSINRINDRVTGFRVEGSMKLGPLDIYAPTTDAVEVRQRIGMVFQRPNPFPQSIYENVAF